MDYDHCANCGKIRSQHNSKNNSCPIGRKHVVYGYTKFQRLTGNIEHDSSKIYKRSFDSPKVGCSYIHKGKPVYVTGGCVVNDLWNFRPINKDDTLGEQQECYGHEFTDKVKCEVVIEKAITKVIINWNKYLDL